MQNLGLSMSDFEEYKKQGEPDKLKKAENWGVAIGLQKVDGLTPFLTNVEAVHDSSEELLKMIKKVDAYTSNLEKRVHEVF